MSIAELVRKMAEAGASPEVIALAAEAVECEQRKAAEARAKRAAQKAKERAVARQSHDNVATVAATVAPEPLPPSPPRDIINPPIHPPREEPRATPSSQLAPVVGAEMAVELIDHRRRMKKPLTVGAAKRLADRLSRTDDPPASARLMIDRGWQGFEPEWAENAVQVTNQNNVLAYSKRSTSGNGKPSIHDELRKMLNEQSNHPADPDMFGQSSDEICGAAYRLLPPGRG